MADYTRSKSYAYGYGGGGSSSTYNDMQLQPYSAAGQTQPRCGDLTLRCYSSSYAQAQMDTWGGVGSGAGGGHGQGGYYGRNNLGELPNDFKEKKGKGWGGSGSGSKSMSWAGAGADAEFQRKKRVASYKMYAVEGKVKGSFRKSFRWLKDRYSQVVYGWW